VHRELDDRARGLDSLQRLFERLGLELERLRVPSVAVDHRRDLAVEARLPSGAFAGRLAGSCREGDCLCHTLSVVRYALSVNRTVRCMTDTSARRRTDGTSTPMSSAQ